MSDQSERRAQILAVFEADLPEGIRILNSNAVTEEIEHGRDVTVQDDELAAEEVYVADAEILVALVEENVLKVGEALGYVVFGLSLDYQDKLKAEGRLRRGGRGVNRLARSLARERAIKQVAREEFDLRHGRDTYGSAWACATASQRRAAVAITTASVERVERALGVRIGEPLETSTP